MQDALRESEQRLKDIIDFLPDATFAIDREGKVILWNRAIEEMTGVQAENMLGRGNYEYALPFYGIRRPILIDLVFKSDTDIENKYHFVRKERDIILAEADMTVMEKRLTLWIKARPLYNTGGDIVGAIESIRDITELRQAEKDTKESRRQLADIIDFLPDATFVVDKDGKVIAWNKAAEEMTGVMAADMLGKNHCEYALCFYGERRPILIDLVLKPDSEIEAKYVRMERRNRALVGESYMSKIKGGRAYVFGMAAALRDTKGNIVGAIESVRDITERRRAEESLRCAEEKYRSIFENAVMGIFQSIPEGRFISANPAFARILGYDSPEELLASITDIAAQVYADPENRNEMLRIIKEKGIVREFEIQALRKGGSTSYFTINARSVCDDSGNLLYYEGTAQDVTKRKLLEARLLQSQKMEAIGTLAGGIAHDFNNILSAIIGYSEMTRGKLQQMELHRYLENILLAGHRAKELVAQILTFSRHTDKELKPVNIRDLLSEALKLLRATIPSTIGIHPEIDPGVMNVLADPTQLHQVLINLCTNAAHAMRESGGVLEVRLDSVKIDQNTPHIYYDLSPGMYVKLTVSDTGTGIPPEILDRIFDPFFTTKEKGEGTGLGLSVVYGIARKHGGTVTVKSTLGQGSAFCVYLPAIERPSESKAIPVDAIPGGNESILLVDDEESLVGMNREILEGIDYRATETTSSIKALEMFRAQPDRFDLVISDMTMPGMTGKELAIEMLKIRPDIPIIFCTGFSDLITEESAKSMGIREFLMKPVSLRQLTRTVRKVLDDKEPAHLSVNA